MKLSKIMTALLTSTFMLAAGCTVTSEGDLPADASDSPSEYGGDESTSVEQEAMSRLFLVGADKKGAFLRAAPGSPYYKFYIKASGGTIKTYGYKCSTCRPEWASKTVIQGGKSIEPYGAGSFKISVYSGAPDQPWQRSRGVFWVQRQGIIGKQTLDKSAYGFLYELFRAYQHADAQGVDLQPGDTCITTVMDFIRVFARSSMEQMGRSSRTGKPVTYVASSIAADSFLVTFYCR